MLSLPVPRHSQAVESHFLLYGLALAFAVRAAFALTTDYLAHPDQIFQYLEQGHRLVFGYGIVPWEYQYGVRSWLIPGFIGLILEMCSALGLDRPELYQAVVRLVFCAVSLAVPWSAYRIAQACVDESTARLALLATALWGELVYYAPTPMPDALSAYAFFAALALLFRRLTSGVSLAFGFLCGLALALRLPLAPMVGTVMLVAIARWRLAVRPALFGFLVIMALAGALDAYSWGRWFSSITANIEINILADVAGHFEKSPSYDYLRVFAVGLWGVPYVGAVGLALCWRKSWPLILAGLAYLAALSAIGHKEARFMLPLAPIYLIGVAVLLARAGQLLGVAALAKPMPPISGYVPLAATLAVIVSAAAILAFRGDAKFGRDDLRAAYLMLSRRADVNGIIDDGGVSWLRSGGYYNLHQPTPIYRLDLPRTGVHEVRRSPRSFARYWLLPADDPAPDGYSLLTRSGRVAIWRRSSDPPQTLIPPGYAATASIPFDDTAIRPKVTPRW